MIWPQLETTTLGDIVSRDFRAGAILDRYGLDYCCGGARTLADGCLKRGVNVERVVSELEALDPASREAPEQDPVALIDHIVSKHHAYVREAIPAIQNHLSKVAAAHGARHPELPFIEATVFEGSRRPVAAHGEGGTRALSVRPGAGRGDCARHATATRHVRHRPESDSHDGDRAPGSRRRHRGDP